MESEMKCRSCLFFSARGNKVGECRVRSPIVDMASPDKKTHWPTVWCDDGCGEWKPAGFSDLKAAAIAVVELECERVNGYKKEPYDPIANPGRFDHRVVALAKLVCEPSSLTIKDLLNNE